MLTPTQKDPFKAGIKCLRACLLLVLWSSVSGGKFGRIGYRQFVLKLFLCNLWLNICHSRHIYSNSIRGRRRWIFYSPDQKKIGRIYPELTELSVLNGFMHRTMILGKWCFLVCGFCWGIFFSIANLRYRWSSQFCHGQAAERWRERNTDMSLGEHLPSDMPPSTEAHGLLHWSTLVEVTDGGLTELNSALICIPREALAC